MSRAQAQSNDTNAAQVESDSDSDWCTQSSEGSSSPQAMSSVGPSQFPVFMADDGNVDDEGTSGDHLWCASNRL